MKILRFILFLFLLFSAGVIQAQDRQKADTTGKSTFKKGKPYVIVMNDGTEYIGEISEDNGREILVNVKGKGKIYIPKYVIKSIELVTPENFKNNEFMSQNNFQRYHMMGTNALPFKKGEFSTNLYYFAAGSAFYNINENFSVGATTTWWGSPIALGAKTSFKVSEKNYVGVDVDGGTIVYSAPGTFFGRLSAKYTYGDENHNFTLSSGLMSVNANTITNGTASSETEYYVSAMTGARITKRAMFVAEVWSFPQKLTILGLGVRSIKKETSSFVFGLYNFIPSRVAGYYVNSGGPAFFPIPYLGYAFKL
jgi:hypothetical protein